MVEMNRERLAAVWRTDVVATNVRRWTRLCRWYNAGFWLSLTLGLTLAYCIHLFDSNWYALPALACLPVCIWFEWLHEDARMSRRYWQGD